MLDAVTAAAISVAVDEGFNKGYTKALEDIYTSLGYRCLEDLTLHDVQDAIQTEMEDVKREAGKKAKRDTMSNLQIWMDENG